MLPSDFGENWNKWDDLFHLNASVIGVTFDVLKAICMNESSLGRNPAVAHGILNPTDIDGSASEDKRSWGLMQLTLLTACDYDAECTPEKLNDPDYSVKIASLFLRNLWVVFGEEEFTIKAYNQGAGATRVEMKGGRHHADDYWARYKAHKGLLEHE